MRLILSYFFTIVLMATWVTKAEGQKCKYAYDEIDPITEERVRTSFIKLDKYNCILHFRRTNDKYQIEFRINLFGELNESVPKGSELILKLTDGSLLKLYSMKEGVPVSYVNVGLKSVYDIPYHCTKEEFEKIAKHGISAVRSQINTQVATYEVKGKFVETSRERATCMLID